MEVGNSLKTEQSVKWGEFDHQRSCQKTNAINSILEVKKMATLLPLIFKNHHNVNLNISIKP